MQDQEEPISATPNPREELELAKLRLEIADLSKPFWKRPSYVLAALPTLLATLTLLYGFTSGYFSASFTKLENQKHDLEAQIKAFDERRTVLQEQNKALESKLTQLQNQFKRVEAATSFLKAGIDEQEQEEFPIADVRPRRSWVKIRFGMDDLLSELEKIQKIVQQ